MKEEIKHVVEAVGTHPKTSYLVVFMTNISNWWVDWGSPAVDAITSILGLVLVTVLIRYHWQNTKKLTQDLKGKD